MGGLRRELPARLLDLPHRRRRACGAAAGHRRLLQQGPDHRHEPGLGGRQRLAVTSASLVGALRHRALRVPARVPRVLRRAHTEVTRRPRWRQLVPLVRARRALDRRRASSGCRRGWAASTRWRTSCDTALPPPSGPAARALRRERRRGARSPSLVVARRHRPRLPALDAVAARHAGVRRARRPSAPLAAFWLGGWGFDWLYERVFVRPVKWFARVARDDLRRPRRAAASPGSTSPPGAALSAGQTGRLRAYVAVAGVRRRPRPRRRGAEVTP